MECKQCNLKITKTNWPRYVRSLTHLKMTRTKQCHREAVEDQKPNPLLINPEKLKLKPSLEM